jgi:alpha-L-fucosidase
MLMLGILLIAATWAAPDDAKDSLRLDIEPLPAPSKASLDDSRTRPHIVAHPDWYNWCPSVIRTNDGAYHMFHTRWPKRIGFLSWLTHSEIVHEVADRPEGPYREVGVVLNDTGPGRSGWFTAHNSKIKHFEGKWYLYFCQTRGTDITDAKRVEIAQKGYKHPKWKDELRPNQRTFLATAESLEGPWTVSDEPIIEPAKTITTLTVNPAVCRGPDGTYFMIVKGDKPGEKRFIRNQALATAPKPEGPWTIQEKPVIDDLDTEDASIWYDTTRNRFYVVFHAHSFIGMMTSADGYTWEKAAQYRLISKHIPFDDGSSWEPDRMERPFVLTDEKGRARMLFVACKRGDMAVIVALPLTEKDLGNLNNDDTKRVE